MRHDLIFCMQRMMLRVMQRRSVLPRLFMRLSISSDAQNEPQPY